MDLWKQEREPPDSGSEDSTEDFYDAEILDEITTNRGEFKLRTVSFNEERFLQVSALNPIYASSKHFL